MWRTAADLLCNRVLTFLGDNISEKVGSYVFKARTTSQKGEVEVKKETKKERKTIEV